MSKIIVLTHPIIGDKPMKEEVARKIMSYPNTGGWAFKKKDAAGKTPAANLTQADGNFDSTDTGSLKDSKENGGN